VPDARIEELDFSVRTYNCLKKANILTIGELTQHTENDLMQIRNFGKKSLLEVRERLGKLDLELKGGNVIAIGPEEMENEANSDNDEEETAPTVANGIGAEIVSETTAQSEGEENPDKPEGNDEPTPEPRKAKRGRASSRSVSNDNA